MNFNTYFVKEKTLQKLRQYFIDHNFHEVETPTLQPQVPLEPNLYPFKTIWQQKNKDFYMAISPESALKKLIAQGIGNCFAISKVFRDLEDTGPTHNLEFSMLEWYEMDKNYQDIITRCQDLFQKIFNNNIIIYQGQKIDITPPWPQATLQELFQKYADIDLSQNLDTKNIIKTAKQKGYNTENITTWEPLYTQIFINEIESKLPQDRPFIITNYPTIISPLCQPCPDNPNFAQRFEFYIGGMEIGNGNTELTDGQLLEKNFKKENQSRLQNNLPTHPYDEELVKAVSQLPPCAGIGIGIDRIAMLLANTANIKDVIYFPM